MYKRILVYACEFVGVSIAVFYIYIYACMYYIYIHIYSVNARIVGHRKFII